MQRGLLLVGILTFVLVAGFVAFLSASSDFVESSDETLWGDEIGSAEREAVERMTGLELPSEAVYHAYHFESALDQRMVALVSMAEKDAEAFLAQPALNEAGWDPASNLPVPTSDLSSWPSSWGEPTQSGRRTTLDVAPGRQLGVSVGDATSDTRTLQITWTTY